METKECIKCKETKSYDDFYKSKYNTDNLGFDMYCKYCRNAHTLKSRYGNKKKCTVSECEIPHYAKGMCRNHYTRMRNNGTLEYQMKYRDGSDREGYLRKKYLLTLEEFEQMAINGCQICGDKPKDRPLHVDHDHACCLPEKITCGKCVRGVVCGKCNMTIGKYEQGLIREDNPLKDKIKEYLNG
jgi:hypothetical protein